MMSRGGRRQWLSLALASLAVASVAVLTPTLSVFHASAQTVEGEQPLLDSEEQAFVQAINDYRLQNGAPPLNLSPTLNSAARWMSEDMAANDYFSHTDSLGRDLFQRMADFDYDYNTWKGENLAAGSDTAAYTFELWRDSPRHNSNMLNPDFVVIGLARAYDSNSTNGWYWTTDFGGFDAQTSMSASAASPDVRLAGGWNHACYTGSQQAIEEVLAPIVSQVLAVYRLQDDGNYDRWLPGRPEISTIATVDPFESLFILTSGDASWVQDGSAVTPASVDLVIGWNSVCYGGLTKSVDEASASVSADLRILYTLDSNQVWNRYVPSQPELSSIAQLEQYDAVLMLVTDSSGGAWTFDP